ncbi:MAG: DUF4405 domain-containing protein [Planctomycetota bacterium]
MRFRWQPFTSLFLTLAFLVLSVSGTILYFSPRGRMANWSGWTLFGLSKEGWALLHINLALIFLFMALLHLIFNWNVFWRYIKKRGSAALNLKAEMLLALLLAAGLTVGSIYEVPPLGQLMSWNMQIKDYWEDPARQAPEAHAEELSLAALAQRMELRPGQAVEALREAGMTVEHGQAKVAEIAEANSVSPRELYETIRKHFGLETPAVDPLEPGRSGGEAHSPSAGEGHGMGQGKGPGGGMGKGKGQGKGMGGGWGGGMGQGGGHGETAHAAEGGNETSE